MNLSWIPGKDNEILKVKKGDIIETINGEKITFIELKRTKWEGLLKGRSVLVPLYANGYSKPYAIKIVGTDDSIVSVTVNPSTMKKGDLFAVEGKKEAYIFKNVMGDTIHAVCIATGKNWSLKGFTVIPIDIEKIKATL